MIQCCVSRSCIECVPSCALRQVIAAAAPGEPPWEQPCKYELQVALERLVASEHLRGGDSAVSVMFLLDGSGSVTEGMVKLGHAVWALLSASYVMCSRPAAGCDHLGYVAMQTTFVQ